MNSVKLLGAEGILFDRVIRKRITSIHAQYVVYHETENAFRTKWDDSSGCYGLWQGEFWGKWMLGAVGVCRYTRNAELKEFIRTKVHKFLKFQEDSGYLGTYRDAMNVFPPSPAEAIRKVGFSCPWNWNVWCRKYTLWGLIEAASLLEDRIVWAAAVRLAKQLIGSLREHGIALRETGTFFGIPSGSILKPMVLLYRETGDQEFLDFAGEIVKDWERADGTCPNLLGNVRAGKPVHQWYPEPKTYAKVYEMLSAFEGILALYRCNGDQRLLDDAGRFHALVRTHELNLLFGVGFNDIFANAARQLNAITEPCDVIHWMRFCGELFELTDEKKYLDDFELAFYNPFLAAVTRDGAWGARGVRSHGRHMFVREQAGMRFNHCCVNNIPRGFLNFIELAVTTRGDTVSVNFYPSASICQDLPGGGRLGLAIEGRYLAEGGVRMECALDGAETAALRLRIPAWAVRASLAIDGSVVAGGDSGWLSVVLPRGVTVLNLNFEIGLAVRWHRQEDFVDEWYHSRWKEPGLEWSFRTRPGRTLVYGPLLLARSKWIGNTEEEMLEGATLDDAVAWEVHRNASDEVKHAFDVWCRREDGSTVRMAACDYASAGNLIQNDPGWFSVFF